MDDMQLLVSKGIVTLGDPVSDPEPWNTILHSEHTWKRLVYELFLHESVCDRHAYGGDDPAVERYTCDTCSIGLPTSRALRSHQRAKHGQTNKVKDLLNSATCPSCGTDFRQRIRCLKHVSDPRRPKCGEWILNNCVPVSHAIAKKLDTADRKERTLAYRAGHTQPIAQLPATRADGKITGRVNT